MRHWLQSEAEKQTLQTGNKLHMQREVAKIYDLKNNMLKTNCISLKRKINQLKYREFIK